MRKGETLEQEAARQKAAVELPKRLEACIARLEHLCCNVRETTRKVQRQQPNSGGERNGLLPE